MRKSDNVWPLSVACGALGALAALTLAPIAQADPEVPLPPPPPGDQQPISVQAAPAGELPPPAEVAPPAEVPHLSSPQNLPPGTTDVPLDAGQGRTTSYLRDLWHAVQTQDISGKDAILLLTQRPLDPNAMPTNGMPAGPQAPPGSPLPAGAPVPDAPPVDGPPPGPALPDLAPPLAPEPPTP